MTDEFYQLLINLNGKVDSLLEAQQVSNFLALANNSMVPEETRKEALNQAMLRMGMVQREQSQASLAFEAETLPTDVFTR